MVHSVKLLHSERLVLLAAVVAAGLGISLLTTPPLLFLLAISVILAACVGSDQLIHAHWRQRRGRRRYDLTLWIFPALIVAGGFLVLRLPVFSTGTTVAIGIAIATGLFVAVVVCQLHSLSVEDDHYQIARFLLTLLVYLSAFAIFSAIYAPRARSAYAATATTIVTILLCLELFRGQEINGRRAVIYSGIVGLAVGQITWALNYWLVSPVAGGVLLLVALYCCTGIVRGHLSHQLTRAMIVEFAGTAVLAVALILGTGLLSG